MLASRYLEIHQAGARISVRNECITVDRGDVDPRTGKPVVHAIPPRELACVVLAHPQASISQPALAALMAAGCPVLVCDGSSLPSGMMLPLVGNALQTQRMLAQALAPKPLCKRLWQHVVRCKVRAQAAALIMRNADQGGDDGGLRELARKVRSGDPDNIEAQAAARYWPLLFATKQRSGEAGQAELFRRRFDAPDQNRLLNYGYAVIRAGVARAICAAGLHPTLGIHHHNRQNPFCLADDLMEPYRPLVDAEVAAIVGEQGSDAPLDASAQGKANKSRLIELLSLRLDDAGKGSPMRPLSEHFARTAFSLVEALTTGDHAGKPVYPLGALTPDGKMDDGQSAPMSDESEAQEEPEGPQND